MKEFIHTVQKKISGVPSFYILGFLLLLYFLTRLWNLTILPIFTDEAIYIYWARVIAQTKSQFFLSMVDGKPPLFIWAMSLLFLIFPQADSLVIGRLVSVGLGAVGLVGVWTLTREMFGYLTPIADSVKIPDKQAFRDDKNRLAPLIASLLFIFSPFQLTYDRLALFDTALVAVTIWAVVAAIRLGRNPTVFNSVILGGLLAVSYLTKPTGMLFWGICPVVTLFFVIPDSDPGSLRSQNRGKKINFLSRFTHPTEILNQVQDDRKKKTSFLKRFLALVKIPASAGMTTKKGMKRETDGMKEIELMKWIVVSLVIAVIPWVLLHFSSAYPSMVAKNSEFQYPFLFVLTQPLIPLLKNVPEVTNWLKEYINPFILGLSIVSLLTLMIIDRKKGLLLLFLFTASIVPLVIIGKQLFPRYILFTIPYLYIAIGATIPYFLKRELSVQIVTGVMILGAGVSLCSFICAILFNPPAAAYPATDYDQFIGKSPSGYGLDALFKPIDDALTTNNHVTIITQGTFGLFPYAFTLRYWNNPNITILPQWPVTIDLHTQALATTEPVFLAIKQPELLPFPMQMGVIIGERPTNVEPIYLMKIQGY